LKLAIVTRNATSGVASGLPGLLFLANHVVDLVLVCRLLLELVFEIGRRHLEILLLIAVAVAVVWMECSSILGTTSEVSCDPLFP